MDAFLLSFSVCAVDFVIIFLWNGRAGKSKRDGYGISETGDGDGPAGDSGGGDG